ncbi:hypothetical protein GCM10010519_04610 [Streptomyces lactacystinicus]
MRRELVGELGRGDRAGLQFLHRAQVPGDVAGVWHAGAGSGAGGGQLRGQGLGLLRDGAQVPLVCLDLGGGTGGGRGDSIGSGAAGEGRQVRCVVG